MIRITRGTLAWEIYGRDETSERYFCNFEVNPEYRGVIEAAGLLFSANSENGEARMLELPGHPFFLATLFQPQLSSKPENPHPLFRAFVRACRAA
jgi:CTP synthase (UTP-ammonia lyase)